MGLAEAVLNRIAISGEASVDDLRPLSLSRASLYRSLAILQDSSQIVRTRRGFYKLATKHDPSDGWLHVCERHPQGVLCLLTALALHQLTTQSPSAVWLALPRGAWRASMSFPPVHMVHFSVDAHAAGIENLQRPGGSIRVYSVAKTVADCFKFRNKIGLDVALQALREGWQQRRFTLDELDHMAKANRVQVVMRPFVEALVV